MENLLLMNDVLAELSMLSQVLQRSSLTIRQAQCRIRWAVEGLQRRKEKLTNCMHLQQIPSDQFHLATARLTSRSQELSFYKPL